jgi:hypothetical protein
MVMLSVVVNPAGLIHSYSHKDHNDDVEGQSLTTLR